jgi:hypothetical protein
MPDFLDAFFGTLSPADAIRPGHDGTLSPVEQCWHLADLEREGFGTRIYRLLHEPSPMLPDFDGARAVRERNYLQRRLTEALDVFREARAANLTALRGAQAGDWLLAGVQEGVGPVALCDLPSMMDEHDEVHRREISAWMLDVQR